MVCPQGYFTVSIVCIHSFFMKKEEKKGRGEMRERRNKADFRVLSLGDWKSNVSFPEVGTQRGRCFGEDKPNSALMT